MEKKDSGSADIREIMTDIKKKAHGAGYECDFAEYGDMPEKRETRKDSLKREAERVNDLNTINKGYYVGYDPAVDKGSPIRAKLGSMIRVRVSPLLERRNSWCASVVRVLNNMSERLTEMNTTFEESDPALMKIKIEELELKLYNASKQIEVMGTRIAELEKALDQKGDK